MYNKIVVAKEWIEKDPKDGKPIVLTTCMSK